MLRDDRIHHLDRTEAFADPKNDLGPAVLGSVPNGPV
jgi:hypothetical protein